MGGTWHHIPVRLARPGQASNPETEGADGWLLGRGEGGVGELKEDGVHGQESGQTGIGESIG